MIDDRMYSAIWDILGERWPGGSLQQFCPSKTVADDCTKLLIFDKAGVRTAVVKFSAASHPHAVREEMAVAHSVVEVLGEALGDVVLRPLVEGAIGGRSFAVLPYCRPVWSSRSAWVLWRRCMSGPILEWLYRVARSTQREVNGVTMVDEFVRPLRWVMQSTQLDEDLRRGARHALDDVERGRWALRQVLMHGDFWTGNVLRPPGARRWKGKFVVIDWAGGRPVGHAVADLVSMTQSLGLGRHVLRAEIQRHCEAIGTDAAGARCQLAARIGHLGMNLREFPPERFVCVASSLWRALSEALSVST